MTLFSQVMTAVCVLVSTTHLSGLAAELVHDLRGQPGYVLGGV